MLSGYVIWIFYPDVFLEALYFLIFSSNKNLLANYYEKKNNKNKKRVCKTKTCDIVLSRYNKESICERCKRERYVNRLVGWGWDEASVRRGLE